MNLLEELPADTFSRDQHHLAQLSALLAGCNDKAGHHIVWVGIDGEVHATCIPVDGPPPIAFVHGTHTMALRLPTAERGLGFVGQDAADCAHWVSEIYNRITSRWRESVCKFVGGPLVA